MKCLNFAMILLVCSCASNVANQKTPTESATASQKPKPLAVDQTSITEASTTATACFWESGPNSTPTQADLREYVNSLLDVGDMPYICSDLCRGGTGCGDAAFWRVVRDGLAAVPFLVDALDDPSLTAANVPNTGGPYSRGDVALVALGEIVQEPPVYNLLGLKLSEECGECSFWAFVRGKPANRIRLKREVSRWLKENASKFERRTGNSYKSLDCVGNCSHPAGGYWVVGKQ